MKFTPSLGRITVRSFNAGGNVHLRSCRTGLGITEENCPAFLMNSSRGMRPPQPVSEASALGSSLPTFLSGDTVDVFGRKRRTRQRRHVALELPDAGTDTGFRACRSHPLPHFAFCLSKITIRPAKRSLNF